MGTAVAIACGCCLWLLLVAAACGCGIVGTAVRIAMLAILPALHQPLHSLTLLPPFDVLLQPRVYGMS